MKGGNPITGLRIAPIVDERIPPIQDTMNQVNQHQIQMMQSQINQNINNVNEINENNEGNNIKINLIQRNAGDEIEIE